MVLGLRKTKNIQERKLELFRQISWLKKENEKMTWQDHKPAVQANLDRLVYPYLNQSH